MKLQIRVDENGIISDVKFKTFGCGSAIASSSYMTERVKGLSLEEAGKIKNTEIAKELCLPPVKLHCSSALSSFPFYLYSDTRFSAGRGRNSVCDSGLPIQAHHHVQPQTEGIHRRQPERSHWGDRRNSPPRPSMITSPPSLLSSRTLLYHIPV